MQAGNPIQPYRSFNEAAQEVLAALRKRLGFSMWLVSRTEGEDWVLLAAEGEGYEVMTPGAVFSWPDSFCYRMVHGLGPRFAPRTAEVEAYAPLANSPGLVINAYVGVPICRSDGTLFGTLCAIDPEQMPEEVAVEQDMVEVMARTLATMLDSDLRAQEDARQIERTRAEALVDELTGLYNRRGWNQLLEAEEARCTRFGHPAGAIVLDLDGLKLVNDVEGHAAGDEMLRTAAEALRASVRQNDVTARLGGDEFAVLAVETPPAGVEELVARIGAAFEERGLCASVGWAPRAPGAGGGLDAAVREADARMYACKRGRRTARPAAQAAVPASGEPS